MTHSFTIEGYAIVTADGMIADAVGQMPDSLKYDADQQFFQAGLDRSAAVIQGRHSYEGLPRAALRKRLVLTRRIASLAPDPANSNARLWNPEGAPIEEALAALGVTGGTLGIVGGTAVFDLFLKTGYDHFHLSRTPPHVRLPGGRPVFSDVLRGKSPETILMAAGLRPDPARVLDAKASVTVTSFHR